MNCIDPKCVYSKRFNKCILPNAYIETIAECGRNKIKRKDCIYHDIKEEAKNKSCKNYRIRTGQQSPAPKIKSSPKIIEKKVVEKKVKKSPKVVEKKVKKSPKVVEKKVKKSPKVVEKKVVEKKVKLPSKQSLSTSAKAKLEKIKKNILARKIANKFKTFITPYVNRVSARLETRIEYYNQLFEILNKINEEQCLKFFNETNGKKQYTLGDNMEILLSKQIGTESRYGIVYLSNINIQYKNLYKFAVKIMRSSLDNKNEAKITDAVSSLTIKNVNPHFPILYKMFVCNTPPLSNQYPKLIEKYKYITLLSELANGDLASIIEKDKIFYSNFEIIKNTIQQIFISILSFHVFIDKIHNDAHWGNFLYHKIKPGGYIHYNIMGVDIYVKNYGYLWIIWDYGRATKRIENSNTYTDYDRIIQAFRNYSPMDLNGWVTKHIYSNEIKSLTDDVLICLRLRDLEKYLWYDKLLKSKLFSKELIKPPDNEIINLGKPYILKL